MVCYNKAHRVIAKKTYAKKKEEDPVGYRVSINRSRHIWLEKTPGYHKDYRKRNPIGNRMRAIKSSANQRGKEMLLTDEEIKGMITDDQSCYYCGFSPQGDKENDNILSIDRLDSSKDYTDDNCVTCCHVSGK